MKPNDWLGVHPFTLKRRGVVAYNFISAFDRLETAHTIQLDANQTDIFRTMGLGEYCFDHPADPEGALLVLGMASLCNEAENPNIKTVARKDGAIGWVVEMTARRDIKPGEEITCRHSFDSWSDLSF